MVRRRVVEGGAQGGVADQQARVGGGALGPQLGLRQQDVRERDRGRGLRRAGQRAHLVERHGAHDLDRADRAVGADAERRQEHVAVGVAGVLDRRDVGDVDLARAQHRVERGGDAHDLLGVLGGEEARERPLHGEGVDEADAPEAQGAAAGGIAGGHLGRALHRASQDRPQRLDVAAAREPGERRLGALH